MKTKHLQIRISEDLKARFDKICDKKYINSSALVRKWIEDFVKEQEG